MMVAGNLTDSTCKESVKQSFYFTTKFTLSQSRNACRSDLVGNHIIPKAQSSIICLVSYKTELRPRRHGKPPDVSFDIWTQLKKYNPHLPDQSVDVNNSTSNEGIY